MGNRQNQFGQIDEWIQNPSSHLDSAAKSSSLLFNIGSTTRRVAEGSKIAKEGYGVRPGVKKAFSDIGRGLSGRPERPASDFDRSPQQKRTPGPDEGKRGKGVHDPVYGELPAHLSNVLSEWTRPSGQPEGGRGAFEGVDPGYLGTFQGKPVFRDDPRLSGGKYDLDIKGDIGITPDQLYGMFGRVPDSNKAMPSVEDYQRQMQYGQEVKRAQAERDDPFRDIAPLKPGASEDERLNWAAQMEGAKAKAGIQTERGKIKSDWQSVMAEQQGKDRRFQQEHNLEIQKQIDSAKKDMFDREYKDREMQVQMQQFQQEFEQVDLHKQLDLMAAAQGPSEQAFLAEYVSKIGVERVKALGMTDPADIEAEFIRHGEMAQSIWDVIQGTKSDEGVAEGFKTFSGR